jgi:hypothetical protein
MGIRDQIKEDYEQELLFMDPAEDYDRAILGVCSGISIQHNPKVVYDYNEVIEANVAMGMSYEESLEYFSCNQEGAYMGEHTPVFMRTFDRETNKKPNSFKVWVKSNLQRAINNLAMLLEIQ